MSSEEQNEPIVAVRRGKQKKRKPRGRAPGKPKVGQAGKRPAAGRRNPVLSGDDCGRNASKRPSTPFRRNKRASIGRSLACRAVAAVNDGAYIENALLGTEHMLQGKERALAWFIAFGTLRHRRELDKAIEPLLRQPMASLDPMLLAVLRCGAYERLFGRNPAPIIVSQWVEVSRDVEIGRASNLVNAVLRRIEPIDGLPSNIRSNHPDWLYKRWTERYGQAAADAWCEANNELPPIFVVAPSGLPPGFVKPDGPFDVSLLEHDCYQVKNPTGSVDTWPGFEEGAFWVQDLSAAKVASMVRPHLSSGAKVLDACAAPGGKTFWMVKSGLNVVSVDKTQGRLNPLLQSAQRLRLPIQVQLHDWETGPCASLASFDAVLVDAPCSGLGTVGRHPEIRWTRHPMQLKAFSSRQLTILQHACTHVAPGGQLVFAVCSDEPEESDAVADAFDALSLGFERKETLRTAPGTGVGDAHVAIRWVKTG